MTAVFSFAGFTSKISASTLRSKTSPLPDASGNCDEPKGSAGEGRESTVSGTQWPAAIGEMALWRSTAVD
jgi:hypothetical protein